MKTLAKWILAGLAFALGVMAAEHCDAYTVRSIRSLAAANSVQNGFSFTNPPAGILPMSPPGGGNRWTVIVSTTSPSYSWQVQGQMTDGTWVPVVPAFQTPQTSPTFAWTSGIQPASSQAFTFFGPFQDMRVSITVYTSGTLTADIYVQY